MTFAAPTPVDEIVPRGKEYTKEKPMESQGSPIYRPNEEMKLQPLPLMKDVLATEHEGLLILKLRQCSVVFDGDSSGTHGKGEDAKEATLFELVRYVTKGGEIAEPAYPEIAKMAPKGALGREILVGVSEKVVNAMPPSQISCNLLRSLPPPENPIFDPEEDDPALEASWPHMQLLDRFDSEDPRERFYLKSVLYSIYRRFVGLRSFIRKHITHVILRHIYETERFNGMAELLEIIACIINGFASPLTEDQKQLLLKVLIPLHKVRYLSTCHPQLQHCVFQFLEKDDSLTEMVVVGLLRYWPKTSSRKEILFLNEVQEILVGISPHEFQKIQNPLFRQIARCVSSAHFQVAESAICLWHRDRITNLIKGSYHVIIPIVFPALYGISKEHLSPPIVDLVEDVLQTFMERQPLLCDELATSFRAERQ
ncbi:unnamed protein product [Darwinula stevensoni]|uniref:Serine/threonine protein phosphatase 2A regulatory subunit n=1 Tax=Darwinula stevensoni TaxID=69355 RepID=A0A7R8XL60_9CRUS|nr:unnamed protein product [Darwinula stevensoni]CAG0893893.1 unnamed protein product [Darwinula stevensoni]